MRKDRIKTPVLEMLGKPRKRAAARKTEPASGAAKVFEYRDNKESAMGLEIFEVQRELERSFQRKPP